MSITLLVGLAVVACSSNSGTTTTGVSAPASTASAGGPSSGASGVNPAPTVGSGGAATGNGASGASGGSVGGSTTGASGNAVSGVSGGAGNPTRIPAPNPDASPSSLAAQSFNVQLTAANQDQPATIDVPRGATVVWTNTSQTNHTVTDDPNKAANKSDAGLPNGADSWDSGPLGPGATFTHIFNTPGQYMYFCAIHETQGMVARITVST
jgi:plastocyanin